MGRGRMNLRAHFFISGSIFSVKATVSKKFVFKVGSACSLNRTRSSEGEKSIDKMRGDRGDPRRDCNDRLIKTCSFSV